MKNILIAIICFAAATTNAQEVTTEQWTHVQKRTADWCPNCGTWGWDFKERIIDEFANDNLLIWSAHMSSSSISSPTSEALVANYGGQGQPVFFIDGANLGVNPNNSDAKSETIRQTLDLNASLPAFYGCASTAVYDTEKIMLNTSVEFFEASGNAPISVAAYLMKKETVASQSGRGSNAVHKNLVINQFTDDAFGEVLVGSNGSAGSTFDRSYELDIEDILPEDYQVVTVLWSFIESTGKYQFLNANISEIVLSVDTEDISAEHSINTIEANNGTVVVEIDSESNLKDAVVTVYAVNGTLVSQSKTNLMVGANTVSLALNSAIAGNYILNLQAEGKTYSEQFYMK